MGTVFRTEASEESDKITKISYVNCGYIPDYAKYLIEYLNGRRTWNEKDRKVEYHFVEKDYTFSEFIEAVNEGATLLGLNGES